MNTKRLRTAAMAGLLATLMMAVPSLAQDDTSAKEKRARFRQGAQLWPSYCGSCHKARPGGERSAAEWDVVMLHMRTRANLPAPAAEAIREYLRAQ